MGVKNYKLAMQAAALDGSVAALQLIAEHSPDPEAREVSLYAMTRVVETLEMLNAVVERRHATIH